MRQQTVQVEQTIRRHVIGRLMDADLNQTPFPHIYCTRIFPEDTYREILDRLPEDVDYKDATYQNRRMVSVFELDDFWKDIGYQLLHWDVIHELVDIFSIEASKMQADVRLVRDSAGYEIKPHSDVKSKLLSLLFYLAEDDSKTHLGTSLMVPKQEDFTTDGTKRYPFEDFEVVSTAPFLPNTMLGFARSNISFHGVKPTDQQRDVLLLNLYAKT